MGRPSKELRTMLGVLLLQESFELTDQDTLHQLAFNIEWHFALNLVNEEDRLKIYFDPAVCETCEHQEYCSVAQNEESKLEYTPKQLRLSQRRAAEESDEFREKYRRRSGIEALNAKFKRKMGMGRLRVRGLRRVRYSITMKALGWNIFQAARA